MTTAMQASTETVGTRTTTPNDPPAVVTGAQALVNALELAGVEVIFGVAGHTVVAFLDALSRSSIRYVSTRHEQIAVHAADGYFRVSHRPAVVLTTSGPGMANTVTALGDASLDCSGVIVISGESQSYYAGRDAFQEVSHHGDTAQWELSRPLTKRSWRVSHPDVLMHGIATAFRLATTGVPGPVLMSVPLDLFSHKQAFEVPDVATRRASAPRARPSIEGVAEAAALLSEARRPVILAGGGAVLADADEALTALAERLAIPVITTLSGQGAISKYHPLYGGFISPFGTKPAHAIIREADVVLVLGSRLAEFDLSSWSTIALDAARTKIIQVDADSAVIGRQYPVTVGLVADASAAATDILRALPNDTAPDADSSWMRTDLGGQIDEWDTEIAVGAKTDRLPIQPERLMAELRAALPADGILFCDAGLRGAIAQNFPVAGPRLIHFPSGWGTMGFAVGASLGAKYARPDVPVVAEIGDGGFTSVLSALITAVEYDIPVVWIVRNNALFSSIAVYHRKHFDNGLFGTAFSNNQEGQPTLDVAAIAAAAGAGSRRVDDPADLREAIADAIAARRPYVLDVVSEPAPRGRSSGYWDVNRVLGEQVSHTESGVAG